MQIILQVAFVSIFGLTYAAPVAQNVSADSGSSNPFNALLAEAANLPGIGTAITDISGALTTFEAGAAAALDVQTTQNELTAGAGCKDMTVIFARGTTEPGNVGLFTDPPFFDALTSMLGANSLAIQGVDYSASVEGFLEGGDPLILLAVRQCNLPYTILILYKRFLKVLRATLVSNTLQTCPNTKLVMSG
jgi:cutinase